MDKNLSEALVTSMYTALLRRKPDPEMRWYVDKIVQDDLNGVTRVLMELLNSQEYRRRIFDSLLSLNIPSYVNYSKIISLGTHCYTSFLIKYAGLKQESYPFDWIFSSQKMVIHCLRTDFREFLRSENFEKVPDERKKHAVHVNKFDNRFYRENFEVEFVFNHHDMAEEANISYFERSVERFRCLCRSTKRSLMVQCTSENPDNLKLFYQTCEVLERIAPNCVLLLIVIALEDRDRLMPEAKLISQDGDHKAYLLRPTSAWQGIDFQSPIDDLAVLRVIEKQGIVQERSYSPWRTL